MEKLKLENIHKTYRNGQIVTALRGISLGFRAAEFVAIVGPSGCGKTTLLNVIGGLDTYDDGDLVIANTSTKFFKDADWDAYRNRSIGFVFQSYNLISHQTVLQNVEIAMTLSGVSAKERKQRALQALSDVGLADQAAKKPNQLSGGQMQRVAVARALVNNPDIILADEPTGALDSRTSVQLMELLSQIAKTRLVIMVTHNLELATTYSSRIVRLLDGEVTSDSNPYEETETTTPTLSRFKKTAMSLVTATTLSAKNLLTKRGRTIITAFAGSIGIIGVALVLALSSGLSSYINTMQTEMLTGFPITISATDQSFDMGGRNPFQGQGPGKTYTEFPDSTTIYNYDANDNRQTHTNLLTPAYLDYIAALPSALPGVVNTISYARGVTMNVLADADGTIVQFQTSRGPASDRGEVLGFGSTNYWQAMPDNAEFILSLYDLIGGGHLPEAKNEIAI
ncbi:MAG: ABC transporter ATP-binding protein, partial [Propionibacteriaceae bacterium]|nr:ABC transporter ATP-binding protein [Propionibacteriaceae bacterium]